MMTPLIDVVFLLLIFFLVAASEFRIPEQMLPSYLAFEGAGSQQIEIPPELKDLEKVIVKVDYRGGRPSWEINNETYNQLADVADVLRGVAKLDKSLPVIIDAADAVPMGDVIDLYDLSRGVGFDKIQFAASVDQ